MTPRDVDGAQRQSGNEIFFFAPALKHFQTDEFRQSCACGFIAVSITGSDCRLMCEHCRAEILGHMRPVKSPGELYQLAGNLAERGGSGMLVSGGSGRDGVVPLLGFADVMARIKVELGLSVIVHTGITSPELAQALAGADVDCAMIDMIGADETIRRVCHLEEAGVEDYRRSLENLVDHGVPAAPHVVIGLDHGRVEGEPAAIDLISELDVKCLVLVGLLPLRGTSMAEVVPPAPEQMGELFAYARERVPDRPVLLGCERPGGRHKVMTDELALRAGLDGIAYPAEGTISKAEQLGLIPRRLEVCCSLAPLSMEKA